MNYDRKKSDNATARDERASKRLRVGMPVKVLKFDKDKLTVDVQPLVKTDIDGEYHSQPPVMAVPIACLCMGKFIVRPWYERGETGYIMVGDSDMDMALKSGDEAEPNTERNHAPEDGVFIGGLTTAVNLPEELPDDALVLACGKDIYIAILEDKILIKGDVIVDGEVTAHDIPLSTHKHEHVATGTGISGRPTP